ncbi:MAG: thioredoxin family protein [Saprospiraceae bacterium]
MKKILLLLAFVAAIATRISAQGIEFFHGQWPEALAKAKAENKLIFVDAFAVWCGPCKRMAAQTFPDPKAGEFFNANFINMKIDMEKPENSEFASKYPVASYPTLFFINGDGKMVLKDVGAKTVEQLLEFGKRGLGTTDKSPEMAARYEAGERDPKFLFDYVKSLNQFGRPSLKITNEYLQTQKDLTTEFNLRFIHEGAVEADSRVFDLLLKNRERVAALVGEEAVKNRIETACKNTARKAIEFQNAALLEEAQDKMAANCPDRADVFAYQTASKFYAATKDAKQYLKTVQGYQKRTVKNNAAQLHELVLEITRTFPNDPKVLGQAEKWAKAAAENGGLPEYYLTLAEIHKRRGDKAKARAAAQKARQLASDKQPTFMQKVDYFLMGLEEG